MQQKLKFKFFSTVKKFLLTKQLSDDKRKIISLLSSYIFERHKSCHNLR